MELHQEFHLSNYQKVSFVTQSRLIDSFLQHKVPEFYQNVFVNYLKTLEPIEAELCMREEIQSLANSTSFIQSYLNNCAEKEKYQNFIRLLMGYNKHSQQSETSKLIKLCKMVVYLRELNYKCSCFLLKIRMKYEQNIHIYQSTEKYYYNSFAIKLDSFRKELLKGQLSQFVEFMPEYDPFFMNIKLKNTHPDKKCNEAIQMLMDFTVEDSYRYLKMRKVLMDWIYMHSRKNNIKKVGRTDLPELTQNQQQYVEYDRLKEELLRERLRDRVSQNPRPMIRKNILSLNKLQKEYPKSKSFVTDTDRIENSQKRNDVSRRQVDIVSLEKFENQNRDRFGTQPRMKYLNEKTYQLLDRNGESPQVSAKFKQRVKSQAFNYGKVPEPSSFVGRIKRLKTLNNDSIQNSPIMGQSKRSETLPFLSKDDRFTDKNRYQFNTNPRFKESPSPNYYYDKQQLNYKNQKQKYNNGEVNKLEKLSNFEINLHPEGNKLNQDKTKDKSRDFMSNPYNSNQNLIKREPEKLPEQKLKYESRVINPKMFSTLKQDQAFKSKPADKKGQPQWQSKTNGQNKAENQYATPTLNKYQSPYREQQPKSLSQSPILIAHKISESNHKRQPQYLQKSQQSNLQKSEQKQTKSIEPQPIETSKKHITPQNKQQRSKTPQKPKQIKSTINYESNDPNKKSSNYPQSKKLQNEKNPNQNPVKSTEAANNKEKKSEPAVNKEYQPTSDKNAVQSSSYKPSKPLQQNSNLGKDQSANQEQRLPNKREEIKNSNKPNQKAEQPLKPKTVDQKPSENKSKKTQQRTKVQPEPQKQPQIKNSQQQSQIKRPNQQSQVKKSNQQSQIQKSQQSQIKNSKGGNQKTEAKRQIKIKVGKFTVQSFKQYLNIYQFHPEHLKNVDIEKLTREMIFQQTYVTEFSINGEPGALAVIYLTSNSKIILRLWAMEQKQDLNLSVPLFKKFIDYVEKLTTNDYLYYKGIELPELAKVGFVKKKDDLFERERKTEPRQIEQQFEQCLAVQCTQIRFVQKQRQDILVSAEIQNFTVENSKASDFLFSMAEPEIPQKLKSLIKFSHNIANFKVLNKLLQKEDCDSYQVNSKINVQNISLSLFNFLSDFRDVFAASEGFIKFYGNLVKETQKQVICSVKLSKNNGRVCFAKGYKTAEEVQQDLKEQTPKKTQFWVPMFNKKLYGRFKNYKTANQEYYANWDITVNWQDQMQGVLKHPQRKGINFGLSTFFVSIQIENNQLFIFQVNENDYLY